MLNVRQVSWWDELEPKEQKIGTYGKRPGTGGDVPSNAETKEVEKGDAQRNDDARP